MSPGPGAYDLSADKRVGFGGLSPIGHVKVNFQKKQLRKYHEE